MLQTFGYDRDAALAYAEQWALKRNPRYLDFEKLGGDCTNFASQCLFAGCGVMNYKPVFGWYYNTASDRTASWSGVQYLYNFLSSNKETGPFATVISAAEAKPGDLVQLGNADRFYHCPVIVGINDGRILVAAHSFDAYMRPLDSYLFGKTRFLHIEGYRK